MSTTSVDAGRLVSIGTLFIFLCAWHCRVTGALSLPACAVLAVLLASYLLYGYLFLEWSSRLFRNTLGIPFQVLCGYFAFNSLLFVLTLCSPFGMAANLALLSAIGAAGAIVVRKRTIPCTMDTGRGNLFAAWGAIMVAGLGATIWCGDIQGPLQIENGKAIFKVWPDVFIHAREISVFAQAHGLATIHDIKLAGGPAPLYHFASYLSTAAINALGGVGAMQAYSSFQLPFGILLTGLAAYCLAGSLFGNWPGVAATAAVVLLPDAFQQGFANRYLSYYFLSQVNLGLLYGIACAALAWLFVLAGIQQGNLRTVLLGYAFFAICLFYKAHIFVANGYLLMMFPIAFFGAFKLHWRVAVGVLATAFFAAVIAYSQTNPRVPVMRLDGSAIGLYLNGLLADYEPGFLQTFFTAAFLKGAHGKLVQLMFAAAMLSISTFGWWVPLLPAALASVRNRVPLPVLCVPVLVVLNYLVMAIGLAFDSRDVGTPDELLNRPLVWAYFVVAAWGAALMYQRWIGSGPPRTRLEAGVLLATLAAALCAAMYHAPNLQTMPRRAGHGDFRVLNAVPACLVDAAGFIRNNAAPTDLIQDSANDPRFVLTALSERQLYVGAVGFGGSNKQQLARLGEVGRFAQMRDAAQLRQFAATHRIAWFLAHPGAMPGWPHEVSQQPVFICGGYRLYHFPVPVLTAVNR